MLKKIMVLFLFCVFGTSLISCTTTTPHYKMFSDSPTMKESEAVLLQIPSFIYLYSFDEKEPSFSVKSSLNSRMIIPHPYRETLITSGLHACIFKNIAQKTKVIENSSYRKVTKIEEQEGAFITSFEAKKGCTYRLMSLRKGEYYYGWVEEFKGIIEKYEVSTVTTTTLDAATRKWANHDWRIVAVALTYNLALSSDQIRAGAKIGINEMIAIFPNYIKK